MTARTEFIAGGTVTSSRGFGAGATYSGIKAAANGALDLGILTCQVPCCAAGVFTTNRFRAEPVALSAERLKSGQATAIVVNSGCANAATGKQGLADAARMAELAAERLALAPHQVLVASTGVIGKRLEMDRVEAGIAGISLSADGGHKLARAMMTTDTVPKEVAVKTSEGYTIGGVAKGAGMIHPRMGTMLCFLTTDATVEAVFLAEALKEAADMSFNMVSIDGDTSPNDAMVILASGLAGGQAIGTGSRRAALFKEALNKVCIHLARAIAADGEGATRLIEVSVCGAASLKDARWAARTVASSSLVKTAVHGSDPNWGRILAAAGRSGARMDTEKADLYIGGIPLLKGGQVLPFDEIKASAALSQDEVSIALDLNLGDGQATAWGCDLTAQYVAINSDYRT